MIRKTLFLSVFCIFFCSHLFACDVTVVSGSKTTDGRPLLWKNRDCSASWHQEIKYFDPVNERTGGYIMVYNHDDVANMNNKTPVNPSGGVNEAGFANACASVYEDFNPIHEAININTDLIRESLQKCVTIEDFENLLIQWRSLHPGKVISGNFGVIDANGGAAMFECYTGNNLKKQMMFTKFDANTGRVTSFKDGKYQVLDEGDDKAPGFYSRTNNHTNKSYVTINYGDERRVRAEEIIPDLIENNNMNYKSLIRQVSKDVTGQQNYNEGASDQTYSTTYCISRNQTRLGLVVHGVKKGESPSRTTFWCALGEPSSAVYIPYFASAKGVSFLAYVDDIGLDGTLYDFNDTCLLARMTNAREQYKGLIYKSNHGSALTGMDYKLINKNELFKVQDWAFKIEDELFYQSDYLLNGFPEEAFLPSEELKAFSDRAAIFVYKNYLKACSDCFPF